MLQGRWSSAAQALLYVVAGVNHFWHPEMYGRIMPAHYSHPAALVAVTGAAEILGGLGLLWSKTRRAAAWGLIVMLLVFLDVHQDMIRHADRFPGIPHWALWARLPLQFLLIAWAAQFAGKAGFRSCANAA